MKKKVPTKKAPARRGEPDVTPRPVETVTRGQVILWNKADLLDPEGADDEESFWPVPDGIWREVNSVTEETHCGEPRVVVEYACSEFTDDDYDERVYAPGTVLATRPPNFRTLKIGEGLSVGDRLVIGDQEWVVTADGLDQSR